MEKYDIFISYRRENGEHSAKAIYDRLRDKGYNVFLDVETLRSGAFNEKLYSFIDQCQDVLVVLSPNALDRCANPDDWVRLEVAQAIRCKKNVIPIMLRGFAFPPELPAEIEPLRFQNGIQASIEFFDAFIEKLCRFLRSKPGLIRRFFVSLSWRRSAITVGACLLLFLGIWGGSTLQKMVCPKVFPATFKEQNDVKSMLYYVQTNLTASDKMMAAYQNALNRCEDYLHGPSADAYQNLVGDLEQARVELKRQAQNRMPLSNQLSAAISNSKVDLADLSALSQRPGMLCTDYDRKIAFLEDAMNPARYFDNATRYRLIEIGRDSATLDAKSLMIDTCILLLPINEKALEEFRTEQLPKMGEISKGLWSRDETSLNGQKHNLDTQRQGLKEKLKELIGDNDSAVP